MRLPLGDYGGISKLGQLQITTSIKPITIYKYISLQSEVMEYSMSVVAKYVVLCDNKVLRKQAVNLKQAILRDYETNGLN